MRIDHLSRLPVMPSSINHIYMYHKLRWLKASSGAKQCRHSINLRTSSVRVATGQWSHVNAVPNDLFIHLPGVDRKTTMINVTTTTMLLIYLLSGVARNTTQETMYPRHNATRTIDNGGLLNIAHTSSHSRPPRRPAMRDT